MNENVYKIIELAGSSKATIEEAVKNALSRASESLRDSRWFEVTQIRGRIVDNEVAFWQVGLKLGFALEGRRKTGSSGPKAGAKQVSVKYRCKVCGYIYDPEKGDPDHDIKPGTPFSDIPDDWSCPECGVNKDQFERID